MEIYYVVSDGVNGEVKASSLTAFNSFSFDLDGESVTSLDDSTYSLTNGVSTSGAEPETIDEAYSNFKKTVGTFNTLVSCKDYSNYIYSYENDESGSHLVSNVQATDVRTDPNRSVNLLTRDTNGMTYYVTELKSKDTSTYNDLIIHGTQPYDYDISNKTLYERTYEPLTAAAIKTDIESALQDVKTISHQLVGPKEDEISMIQERYALNVNISTKYKVNSPEQSDILKNVVNALYNAFNAREVEFGEEIPYDEIVNVIQNADERIKLAVVDDPVVTPYIIKGNKAVQYLPNTLSEGSVGDAQKIVVENILGGRIQLYITDNSFDFDYTYKLSTLSYIGNLAALKTSLSVSVPIENDADPKYYELRTNEAVQIVEDSYISTVTYPAYVYFGLSGDDIETTDGVPYKLAEGQTLYIYYTDTNDSVQIKKYTAGTVIRTNGLGLPNVDRDSVNPSRWYDTKNNKVLLSDPGSGVGTSDSQSQSSTSQYISMYALGTDETIEILKLNETVLKDSQQKCFWCVQPLIVNGKIVDQKENDLVFYKDSSGSITKDGSGSVTVSGTFYHILEENEMFLYPSEDGFSLFTLGSGTMLQITFPQEGVALPKDSFVYNEAYGSDTVCLKWPQSSVTINLEDLQNAVNDQNIDNFLASYNWVERDLSEINLHLVETSITTYVEGNQIVVQNVDNPLNITSNWTDISNISIKDQDGNIKNIGSLTSAKVRSILSFTGTASNPQKIESNQVLTLYYYDNESDSYKETDSLSPQTVEQGKTVQLNGSIDSYNDVVLRVMNYAEDGLSLTFNETYSTPYKVIYYELYDNPQKTSEDAGERFAYVIKSSNLTKSSARKEYALTTSELSTILGESGTSLVLSVPANLNLYVNVFDQFTGETHLSGPASSQTLTVDLSYLQKYLDETSSDKKILISVPQLLTLNPSLVEALDTGDSASVTDKIIQYLKDNYKTYDYLAPLNNSKIISSYDILNSFFDYNNVYNPLTIAKIDFGSGEKSGSNFNIVASSRK